MPRAGGSPYGTLYATMVQGFVHVSSICNTLCAWQFNPARTKPFLDCATFWKLITLTSKIDAK